MSRDKYLVATRSELDDGPQRVTVNNKKLLIYQSETSETVYAYRNVCPHQNGPVVEGRIDVEANKILCPWHGWEFDLEGGGNALAGDLARRLPQLETMVEGEEVYVLM